MENARHSAGQTNYAPFIVGKLRQLRSLRGLSVAELARRSDMDESQLGKVCRIGCYSDLVALFYQLGFRI